MTIAELLDLVSKGGVLGLLLLILWTGHRGAWVWGRDYDKCVADLERRTKLDEEKVIPLLTDAIRVLEEHNRREREG